MKRITDFDSMSEKGGFIVVYPDGVSNSWADGRGTTDAEIDDEVHAHLVAGGLEIDVHRLGERADRRLGGCVGGLGRRRDKPGERRSKRGGQSQPPAQLIDVKCTFRHV